MRREADTTRTQGLARSLAWTAAVLAAVTPRPALRAAERANPDAERKTGVLLWDFVQLGAADTSFSRGLANALEQEVATWPEHRLIRAIGAREAIARDGEPSLLGCAGETGCLAAAGEHVGADVVVYGNLVELSADSWIVNLRAVAPTQRREVGLVSETIRFPRDNLGPQVTLLFYRLLAPHLATGTLTLLTDKAGAQVDVDGETVGTTPLAPLPLTVGAHNLRIRLRGYRDYDASVDIRFREDNQIQLVFEKGTIAMGTVGLRDMPAPPRQPKTTHSLTWTGLAVGGAGIAATAGGLVFALKAARDEKAISDLFASGGTWSDAYDKIDARGRRNSRTAALLLVTGGVATAVGALVYVLSVTGQPAPAIAVSASKFDSGTVITASTRF